MTVLTPATGVNQIDGEAGEWEHCGEAVISSWCDDAGLARPVVDVVTALKAHGMNPDNGTPGDWLVWYLAQQHVASHRVTGDSNVDLALDAGKNLFWCVFCDGRGNINGSRHTTHWVRVWGHDGTGVHYMNPLGDPVFGQNHIRSDVDFFGNSTGEGVVIDNILPADFPRSDQVDQAQANEIIRANLLLSCYTIRPTALPDQADAFVAYWWSRTSLANLGQVVHTILSSPEGVAESLLQAGIAKSDHMDQAQANELIGAGLELALHIIRPAVTPDQVDAFIAAWRSQADPQLRNWNQVIHAILSSPEGIATALRAANIDHAVAQLQAAQGQHAPPPGPNLAPPA